jgi:hypothetical protein
MISADEQNQKSEWNIDDAVLKAVFSLKIEFLSYLQQWNLEQAYWVITLIDAEITPALKEKHSKEVQKEVYDLEISRKSWLQNSNDNGKFWLELRRVYKKMNEYMVDEGWYFRRKELYMGL